MAKFCDSCNAFFKQPLSGHESKDNCEKKTLHATALEFRHAVETGCHVCRVMHSQLDHHSWDEVIMAPVPDHAFITYKLVLRRESDNNGFHADAFFYLEAPLQNKFSDTAEIYSFELESHHGFFMPSRIPRDIDIGPTTGPGKSMDQLQQWLTECDESHEECAALIDRQRSSFRLPTRLVDTGTDADPSIRLCITKDGSMIGKYATLSHCWGKTPTIKLLTENLAEMEKEIKYEDLTKTFQDAVIVTRSLGLRYIWIDSLCIIQDSLEDWQKEGLQMADVYSNSYLNIAAAHSRDGHGGLFTTRDAADLQPIYIDTDWAEDGQHRMFLRDEHFWVRGVDQAPLHQRGWVFQERALAVRTAHFGSNQIFWECLGGTYTENFPLGPVYGSVFGDRVRLDLVRYSVFEAAYVWSMALKIYTRCAITQESDKLVAIAGVAQRLQELSGAHYVAGLWREEMPNNLGWYVVSPHLSKRAEIYRAPSWSWAALDAEIMAPTQGSSMSEVCFVDCSVQNVQDNPFSQVISGYVRLKWARLHAGILTCDVHQVCSLTLPHEEGTNPYETAGGDYRENLYLDTIPLPGCSDVFLLPLDRDYWGNYVGSLILSPASDSTAGTYRRIGLHSLHNSSRIGLLLNSSNYESRDEWFEDPKDHVIRLV